MSNRPTPELLEKHTEMQREIATEAVEHAVTLMEACRTHGVRSVKVAGIELEMADMTGAYGAAAGAFLDGSIAYRIRQEHDQKLKAKVNAEIAEANREATQSAPQTTEAPLDPETADLETLYHSAQ